MRQRFDTTEAKQFSRAAADVFAHFPKHVANYFIALFPIAQWIRRYNLTWFTGDIIAGLTVGLLILPQGLAQAKIATLPPEYGLYTGFVGLCVYAFFATSKDATIGPTAVLSLLVSQLLIHNNTDANGNDIYPRTTFAITLAFMTGVYQLIIGFFRLGFLASFIPSTVIQGFTTGAAVSIVIQQLPSLLGISGIDTNKQAIYLALKDIILNLYRTKVDAAMGISATVLLVALKVLKETVGNRRKWAYWVGIARNGIVLILYLIISYIIIVSNDNKSPFAIVGKIPIGFRPPQLPSLDAGLIGQVWIPAFTSTLISIVEHVGIVKAFGKKYGYSRNINASQEIVAVGFTNFLGSFMSAYPATGSFSRSAVKAASGVRTPVAGLLTSVIVVIGLYGLTGVFYYIPNSVLAAIIIAAISELISSYDTFVEFWNVGFFDFLVFITAILVTIFAGIEMGIYISVGLAAFIVLMRLARPKIETLTRLSESEKFEPTNAEEFSVYNGDILIVRFSESIEYPNAMYVGTKLLEIVTKTTLYGGVQRKPADRLWFDDTEEKAALRQKGKENVETVTLTTSSPQQPLVKKDPEPPILNDNSEPKVLRAIVFDFSAVNVFDQGGFNVFRESRDEISRYAGRPVYMYFANVKPSIQRNILRLLRTPYSAETLPLIRRSLPDETHHSTHVVDSKNSVLYQSTNPSKVFFGSVEDAVIEAFNGAAKVSMALKEADDHIEVLIGSSDSSSSTSRNTVSETKSVLVEDAGDASS